MPDDPHHWRPVIGGATDDALSRARSALACCDADILLDVDDVKDELTTAIQHLEIAARMLTATEEG